MGHSEYKVAHVGAGSDSGMQSENILDFGCFHCNHLAYLMFGYSLQEAVLGLKTRFPITVILERGEGFFRWLRVKSSPHFRKEQFKRRNSGASNIQADADRCRRTGRLSALSTSPDERKGRSDMKGKETFLSERSPTIDVIRLNLIVLCLQQSYR